MWLVSMSAYKMELLGLGLGLYSTEFKLLIVFHNLSMWGSPGTT